MQNSKLKTLFIYNFLDKFSDDEHPLSTTDLISMLADKGIKCERKSIYADIAALNEIGCDIVTVTSPKRGFFMATRTFEIPEVMLLIDAVSSAGFITPKKTESLIEKLETLVSVEQAKTMKSQVYVDTNCAKCDNEEIYIIIDRLNSAITENKKVKFIYRRRSVDVQNRKKHTEKTFTVSPYALIWRDDHYYLVCNNQKYDNLMNLRIDRMKKLEILDENSRHFSEVSHYKEKFDEQDYVSKRFNMFSGDECKVTLKCNIQLQEEMLDRFGKNIPLTAVDGSHFETTVSATMSDGFVSWLMQYGDGVEVTSPRHFSEVSHYKEKFDEQDYVSKRFNMFSGDECKVTLKCNIQLQEEMLDRFGKNIPLTAVDGSHFETTVSATMSDGFVSWLMQYGDGVEVTSPKNLAKMVRDKAKSIYNIYKGKL